jgi:hypothetical protein
MTYPSAVSVPFADGGTSTTIIGNAPGTTGPIVLRLDQTETRALLSLEGYVVLSLAVLVPGPLRRYSASSMNYRSTMVWWEVSNGTGTTQGMLATNRKRNILV